jgi:hypothetical protein
MDTKKFGTGIKIFGAVLAVVCIGGLIWSLFRKPVTKGPMPDPFAATSASASGSAKASASASAPASAAAPAPSASAKK